MGRFIFEQTVKVEFEDRLLSHLEHVMTSKLRRSESFTFTWREDVSVGGGRTTVWVHPQSVLMFKFHGSRSPRLNPLWLQALMHTANGPHGLYVVAEPPPAAPRITESLPPMTFRLAQEDVDPNAAPAATPPRG